MRLGEPPDAARMRPSSPFGRTFAAAQGQVVRGAHAVARAALTSMTVIESCRGRRFVVFRRSWSMQVAAVLKRLVNAPVSSERA